MTSQYLHRRIGIGFAACLLLAGLGLAGCSNPEETTASPSPGAMASPGTTGGAMSSTAGGGGAMSGTTGGTTGAAAPPPGPATRP